MNRNSVDRWALIAAPRRKQRSLRLAAVAIFNRAYCSTGARCIVEHTGLSAREIGSKPRCKPQPPAPASTPSVPLPTVSTKAGGRQLPSRSNAEASSRARSRRYRLESAAFQGVEDARRAAEPLARRGAAG